MSPLTKDLVAKTLDSGFIGQGPRYDELEKDLGLKFGKKPILTNSCSSALIMSLKLAGVGPGDYVISTPNTCYATSAAIIEVGARICWADTDPITGNISPESVADWMGMYPTPKAIMAVNWAGRPCDYTSLKSHGIPVIEDAAHCMVDPRGLNHGDYICYSLGPIKFWTSGDGGVLFTPEDKFDRAYSMSWYGLDRRVGASFRCLHSNTRVIFEDGTTESIQKVVNNKIDKKVLCFNEDTNEWEPVKIKSYIKSPLGDRKYLKVQTDSSKHQNTYLSRTIVTNDHKLKTKSRGWVRADEVLPGEEILTRYIQPSWEQMEVLVGSILGDGRLERKSENGSAVYSERHSTKQSGYLKLKGSALKGMDIRYLDVPPNKSQSNPYGSLHMYTLSNPSLDFLHDSFYTKLGKGRYRKIVNLDLVKKYFSTRLLATWFMDDGNTSIFNYKEGLVPSCQIATCSFNEQEVAALVEILNSHGYSCKPRKSGKFSRKDMGWRIYFTKEGSIKLCEDISPFVPTEMRYKVGHMYKPYDPKLWNLNHGGGFYDKSTITEYKTSQKIIKTTYCLEVDSPYSNFKVNNLAVSNCSSDILDLGGFKYHMNDIAASIALSNYEEALDSVKSHRANAEFYNEAFKDLKTITPPPGDPNCDFWIYSLLVEKGTKEEFIEHMAANGVACNPVHRRNDTFSCVSSVSIRGRSPGLDNFSNKQVAIPCGWWLTPEDKERIVKAVKSY